MNETEQLKQRIEKLEAFVASLQAESTIPLEVERALNARLQIVNGYRSGKTAASGSAVAGGVPVAIPMDGFVTIVVNGTPRVVPYYPA